MRAETEKFIAELLYSLQNSSFVKLTLGNYKGPEEHLQRISIRRIETKRGEKIAFQSRYSTRDVVKNFEWRDAVDHVRDHLENGFRSAHLFTTDNDFQLTVGKKSSRLTKGKPSFASKPTAAHDRQKTYLVDTSAYFLKALGITTDSGQVRSDQRDKWRQINKFVEIVDGLIRTSPLVDKGTLRIVDMGSGKGYLTFALFDHLRNRGAIRSSPTYEGGVSPPRRRGGYLKAEVIGVEQRKELVTLCNDIAEASEFDGLKFVQGAIVDFELGEVDILIALHACDTATDDALFKGIASNASIIVAAPCCHQELKKQLKPPELLDGILKHPVLLERTAETLTDGIRTLLLEAKGYKTKMFEFVATEHTPKNNMLVATRVGSPYVSKGSANNKFAEVNAIMSEFGISSQHLKQLLDK
jgi:hypothetical protein